MKTYTSLADDYDKEQMNKLNKSFGKNIKEIRLSKKITQEKAAELACINPKYLGEIERGLKRPSAVVVHNLSKALGVPICEILQTDGCPHAIQITEEFSRLFAGKKEDEKKKAIRILEAFFE